MKSRHATILTLAFLLTPACDEEPAQDASFHTEEGQGDRQLVHLRAKAIAAAPAISAALERVQYATHNGNGHDLGVYSPYHFDMQAARTYLQEEDAYYDCAGRRYLEDDEVVAEYDAMVERWEPYLDAEYEEEGVTPEAHASLVRDLLTDPNNAKVLMSAYDDASHDESYACGYWNILVYREDGLVLSFDYNFTD
jgi:hypothetical protein